MFSRTRLLKMGYVPCEGFLFLSLPRLMQTGYVLGLSAVISLLLSSATSKGQFRHNQMPPPPALPPLNNLMTDSTDGAMTLGMMGGMASGMMGMGGGMMGMMGMGGMNVMGMNMMGGMGGKFGMMGGGMMIMGGGQFGSRYGL